MFSKTCKYGLRAILFLAINTSEEEKLGVEELAATLGIPKHFLAKILQELARKKIISSSKGRHGGFYLNESNRAVSIAEVIKSIDGPEAQEGCLLGLPECSDKNPCPFHFSATEMRKEFNRRLSRETIGDLAKQINEQNFSLKI